MAETLLGFAAKLLAGAAAMHAEEHEALERAAVILETEAKDLIGVPNGDWPPLAQVTIDRKGSNTPLLDTGEMKDSIQHNSDSREAYVGSNNKKLLYHEFGSDKKGAAWGSTNPPRPVLKLAMVRKEAEILKEVGRKMVHALEVL